jgi:putative two-component system response regulator
MGTVLVVDDIAGNARSLESLLAPDGHAVRTAGDGAEALRVVRVEPPDLVLMDVMMPHVDRFEACRAIKQEPSTRLIPVVFVTSLDDTASRILGIEAGADDFVSKPFNAHELRARVRSLLRIKRYTDELDSAESVIVSLALTIEARDATTDGHCQRLAQYASALGRTLGLDENDVATPQ